MQSAFFASGGRIVNRETDLPGSRLEIGTPNIAYRHILREPGNLEEEVWIELRLDADWVAAYLIEPVDGDPMIAEIRVLPYEDDAERNALLGPGEWSRRDIPPGGVPIEKLRRLRAADVLRLAREHAEECLHDAEYLNDVLTDFGLGASD